MRSLSVHLARGEDIGSSPCSFSGKCQQLFAGMQLQIERWEKNKANSSKGLTGPGGCLLEQLSWRLLLGTKRLKKECISFIRAIDNSAFCDGLSVGVCALQRSADERQTTFQPFADDACQWADFWKLTNWRLHVPWVCKWEPRFWTLVTRDIAKVRKRLCATTVRTSDQQTNSSHLPSQGCQS